MSILKVKNIKKSYLTNGKHEVVFEDLSLCVDRSEIVACFGPNGCGKTTLFNMIAGIIEPDSGELLIEGERPRRKNVGYVFQDYRSSLFPWLSIKDNIIFPLTLNGMSKRQIYEKLESIVDLFNLSFNLKRYPYELSGGQQQCASIMRTLIAEPDIMLLDEPLSALDCNNAFWLRDKISEILETVKVPSFFVSHDIDDVIYLADRIFLLSDKPAKVVRAIEVDIPRPRTVKIFSDTKFLQIKEEIMDTFFSKAINVEGVVM